VVGRGGYGKQCMQENVCIADQLVCCGSET